MGGLYSQPEIISSPDPCPSKQSAVEVGWVVGRRVTTMSVYTLKKIGAKGFVQIPHAET